MAGVFANGLEISGKAVQAKTIAAMPDVCFTPPENPATPPGVPIPYPSFGMASDTENGTGTVFIGGKTVNIKNKSDVSKTSGTEAGCAAKKGIITSKNTGKKYFNAWSNDVKFDGEGVIRFGDIATHNHASPAGNAPAWPEVALANPAPAPPPPESCPCCGATPPHPHQTGADGRLLPRISEQDYYRRGQQAAGDPTRNAMQEAQERAARQQANLARVGGNPGAQAAITAAIGRHMADVAVGQARLDALQADLNTLEDARTKVPPCPNLHDPPDTDCGVHFDRVGQPPVDRDALGFDQVFRANYRQAYDLANGTDYSTRVDDEGDNKVNHKTALDAGGCPTNGGNLIPQPALSADCAEVDRIQGQFQGKAR